MSADTPVRILDITERLVMQRGYHAFSYQHIAEELGIRAPAVHYHYRTKPKLVGAMLDRYRAQFRQWVAEHEDADPVAQLDAYLQLSRGFVRADRVCALGMMATDFNVVPDDLRARTRELQDEIFSWFSAVLARGRADGSFDFVGPVDAKAAEVACTLLGAQQLGRIRGVDAFEGVAAQIRRSVGAP